MYIAESTSVAIRLNTSWALSMPGMSLTRDRYEQALRFTWLARQPDHAELVKYIAFQYAKAAQIQVGLTPEQKAELARNLTDGSLPLPELPTKDERQYLERWGNLDLYSMAQKRDALPSTSDNALGRESLADLYTPIYRQFSSASHYDMYSMNMISLQEAPSGNLVLAPDPYWPAVLLMYAALFDLIQCNEALTALYGKKDTSVLTSLHQEWREYCKRMFPGENGSTEKPA